MSKTVLPNDLQHGMLPTKKIIFGDQGIFYTVHQGLPGLPGRCPAPWNTKEKANNNKYSKATAEKSGKSKKSVCAVEFERLYTRSIVGRSPCYCKPSVVALGKTHDDQPRWQSNRCAGAALHPRMLLLNFLVQVSRGNPMILRQFLAGVPQGWILHLLLVFRLRIPMF